ncbi:Hpt domain-containing protein [Enterobacter roggenkampii]|uniref:Hpt domain-containing protein n=1 Tax=Enterobacter roggenkampii TaxID=1812935 RepID=UPI003A5CD580
MKAITLAIDNDDREALRRAAHKLRGEAVTLEGQQLAALNQQLQKESLRLMAWLNARGVNA